MGHRGDISRQGQQAARRSREGGRERTSRAQATRFTDGRKAAKRRIQQTPGRAGRGGERERKTEKTSRPRARSAGFTGCRMGGRTVIY